MCENFLPRYSTDRTRSVRAYYATLEEYLKRGNATRESLQAIAEVRELELSGIEEHKVDFPRFQRDLKASGLEIEEDIPVWQPGKSKCGSRVLLLR